MEKKRKKRSEDGSYRHPIFLGLSAVQLSDPQVKKHMFYTYNP